MRLVEINEKVKLAGIVIHEEVKDDFSHEGSKSDKHSAPFPLSF